MYKITGPFSKGVFDFFPLFNPDFIWARQTSFWLSIAIRSEELKDVEQYITRETAVVDIEQLKDFATASLFSSAC